MGNLCGAGKQVCSADSIASSPAEPSSVDLEKVANIIADQSLKDCMFSKEAGRICYTIIQVRECQYADSKSLLIHTACPPESQLVLVGIPASPLGLPQPDSIYKALY